MGFRQMASYANPLPILRSDRLAGVLGITQYAAGSVSLAGGVALLALTEHKALGAMFTSGGTAAIISGYVSNAHSYMAMERDSWFDRSMERLEETDSHLRRLGNIDDDYNIE